MAGEVAATVEVTCSAGAPDTLPSRYRQLVCLSAAAAVVFPGSWHGPLN